MGFLLRLILFVAVAIYIAKLVRRAASSPSEAPHQNNPYEVLGIEPGSSEDQIRSAYRKRLAEYHPDKVASLGKELQDLALAKTERIIAAYETLSKRTPR